MLVNHANTHASRIAGTIDLGLFPPEEDLSTRRLVQTGKNVHEGRLASAVLSQKGVHLAFVDAQGNVIVGKLCPEPLAYVLHAHELRHAVLLSTRVKDRMVLGSPSANEIKRLQ